MKIYIATSWKTAEGARALAELLRARGHEVDCFCDPSTGRYVFDYREVEAEADKITAPRMLRSPQAARACEEDYRMLDWCEAVILLLPCGNSAHMEAGYALGKGKHLYILGEFLPGKWDVMYGRAEMLFGITKEGLAGLEIALATPDVEPEDVPVFGAEWQRGQVDYVDDQGAGAQTGTPAQGQGDGIR